MFNINDRINLDRVERKIMFEPGPASSSPPEHSSSISQIDEIKDGPKSEETIAKLKVHLDTGKALMQLKDDIQNQKVEEATDKLKLTKITPEQALSELKEFRGSLSKEKDSYTQINSNINNIVKVGFLIQTIFANKYVDLNGKPQPVDCGTIDGIMGGAQSNTRDAIRAFQEAAGITVDGMVGEETLSAIIDRNDILNSSDTNAEGKPAEKEAVKQAEEIETAAVKQAEEIVETAKEIVETAKEIETKISETYDEIKDEIHEYDFNGAFESGEEAVVKKLIGMVYEIVKKEKYDTEDTGEIVEYVAGKLSENEIDWKYYEKTKDSTYTRKHGDKQIDHFVSEKHISDAYYEGELESYVKQWEKEEEIKEEEENSKKPKLLAQNIAEIVDGNYGQLIYLQQSVHREVVRIGVKDEIKKLIKGNIEDKIDTNKITVGQQKDIINKIIQACKSKELAVAKIDKFDQKMQEVVTNFIKENPDAKKVLVTVASRQ